MPVWLGVFILLVVIGFLIATVDKWLPTTIIILAILFFIEIGSHGQLPLFTYLIDGIKGN